MTENEISRLTPSGVVEAWAKRHGISGSALEDLRAEIQQLPDRVVIRPPPMPRDELIDHLRRALEQAHADIARLRYQGPR